MIVDLTLPGITVRPIGDLTGDQHFNEVFFDDVLLPHDALIGEEGAGWEQVTAELAFERSGPERIYSQHGAVRRLAAAPAQPQRADAGRAGAGRPHPGAAGAAARDVGRA